MSVEENPAQEFGRGGGLRPKAPRPGPLRALRVLLALSLLVSHLVLQFAMGRLGENPHIIFSDGVGYFSYFHSLLFDRDLDFRNEYERLLSYSPEVLESWLRDSLPDGRPRNIYAVGPAVFWAPFYLAGHAAALLRPGESGWPADGLSFPYQLAVVLGSFLYGLAGTLLLERLLRSRFPPEVAFAAAWSSLLATPVVYYMLFEPSMAHAMDFFAVAAFLTLAERCRRRARPTLWGSAFLGLAVGVLFLVRWINALFLAWAALAVWRAGEEGGSGPAALARRMIALAAGFWVGSLPQLLVWKGLFGAFFVVPGGEGYFQLGWDGFWGTLFSARNGLYVWTPLAAAGTAGLFVYRGWGRPERMVFFALFLAAVCINALVHDWWGGHSFGMRRLIGFFPFLAFGLAEVIHRAGSRLLAVHLLLAGLAAWNGYLMVARKLVWWPN